MSKWNKKFEPDLELDKIRVAPKLNAERSWELTSFRLFKPNGACMENVRFAEFQPPRLSARSILPDVSVYNKETKALLNLAKMLGAEDIFVIGRVSGSSSWITIHAGQKCADAGVDAEALAAQEMREGSRQENKEACWIRPPSAKSDHGLFVTSFRGSNSEIFVVALLFNVSIAGDQAFAEDAVQKARAFLLVAVELCLQVTQLQSRLNGSRVALDRLDVGIILLNANCDILYESGIAKRLLDVASGVRRRGRQFTATDLTDAVRLRVAIEHVLGAVEGKKSQVPLLTLKREKGQRPLLASVVAARADTDCVSAVSLVIFLHDPDREVGHLLRSACRLYRLSPVETELSCRLASGDSITEAAAALRIKELTARGYLKQIFVKTGVNRQAALVQLLLSSMIHLNDAPDLFVM